ncbi:MAG: dihydrofolate reductase [Candidatus Spechtbacterales bacterium]|nr:dihydrofolate reductase [Candidatus Spechtbacterales bacterium]
MCKKEHNITVSLVAAMGKGRVIGSEGGIPWLGDLPDDLKHFKSLTIGSAVVMGRKTWDSLPEVSRPLPERQNIILTRNTDFAAEGADVAHSVDDVFDLAPDNDTLFVIGGAEIYKLFLPHASFLHLTLVEYTFDGDAYFPEIDFSKWTLESSKQILRNQKNLYSAKILTLKRKSS